jgi:hypothetical protein
LDVVVDKYPWIGRDTVLRDKLGIGRVADGGLAEKRGGGVLECVLPILRVSSAVTRISGAKRTRMFLVDFAT